MALVRTSPSWLRLLADAGPDAVFKCLGYSQQQRLHLQYLVVGDARGLGFEAQSPENPKQ